VQLIVEKNATTQSNFLQFEVLYSSTCPQSASLSMEILKSQNTMPERLPATPHAQRSRAQVRVQIKNFSDDRIGELITLTEGVLKTPVQTAVKKADEMEFAVLNAQNLMFCEDAARLVAEALVSQTDILGFSVFCEHQESLHPHNASSLFVHNLKALSGLMFS
jgi:GTP cyclohydrolase I